MNKYIFPCMIAYFYHPDQTHRQAYLHNNEYEYVSLHIIIIIIIIIIGKMIRGRIYNSNYE